MIEFVGEVRANWMEKGEIVSREQAVAYLRLTLKVAEDFAGARAPG